MALNLGNMIAAKLAAEQAAKGTQEKPAATLTSQAAPPDKSPPAAAAKPEQPATPPANIAAPAKPVGVTIAGLGIKTDALPQSKETGLAASIGASIATNSILADALSQAKAHEAMVSVATPTNPTARLDPTSCDHDAVRAKIHEFLDYQLREHPQMPYLLQEIHTILVARHDIVAVLTDEEIGMIVGGLAKAQNVILATETATKAKSRRVSSRVSVDDV